MQTARPLALKILKKVILAFNFRAESEEIMTSGSNRAYGNEDEFDELMKELYTDEEISEFDFKARFLDTVLKAYDENMGISRKKYVQITVDYLENLKIKEHEPERGLVEV